MLEAAVILLLLLYVEASLFGHVEQPADSMHLLLLLRTGVKVLVAVGTTTAAT